MRTIIPQSCSLLSFYPFLLVYTRIFHVFVFFFLTSVLFILSTSPPRFLALGMKNVLLPKNEESKRGPFSCFPKGQNGKSDRAWNSIVSGQISCCLSRFFLLAVAQIGTWSLMLNNWESYLKIIFSKEGG